MSQASPLTIFIILQFFTFAIYIFLVLEVLSEVQLVTFILQVLYSFGDFISFEWFLQFL
jgi:hypothetical protein